MTMTLQQVRDHLRTIARDLRNPPSFPTTANTLETLAEAIDAYLAADGAKVVDAARDASYGRALMVAMNCEYQQAKQMRGKKQEEWVTIYALLHRLKSAADNLSTHSATGEKDGEREGMV